MKLNRLKRIALVVAVASFFVWYTTPYFKREQKQVITEKADDIRIVKPRAFAARVASP